MINNEQIVHYQCPKCERIVRKKMPFSMMNIIDTICDNQHCDTPFYCKYCSKGNKRVWLQEIHCAIVISKTSPKTDVFNQM